MYISLNSLSHSLYVGLSLVCATRRKKKPYGYQNAYAYKLKYTMKICVHALRYAYTHQPIA